MKRQRKRMYTPVISKEHWRNRYGRRNQELWSIRGKTLRVVEQLLEYGHSRSVSFLVYFESVFHLQSQNLLQLQATASSPETDCYRGTVLIITESIRTIMILSLYKHWFPQNDNNVLSQRKSGKPRQEILWTKDMVLKSAQSITL